jgi:hypothetical protein
MTPSSLIVQWLHARLAEDARIWFDNALDRVRQATRDTELNLAFGLVSRKLGKSDLALSAEELRAADAVRAGWDPELWSVDQAARIALVLATPGDADAFVRRLDLLCATADVAELVALYRGLPLYPWPERHRLRAAEGVRTNMKAVFEAVAHANPYPAEQLPEGAWNQMVLKALFVGSALDPVLGLDRRANPALAQMLCDYAHERWSASRPVSPELWRCVGPFARGAMVDDLSHVIRTGTESERLAAALALWRSPDPAAANVLQQHASLAAAAAASAVRGGVPRALA